VAQNETTREQGMSVQAGGRAQKPARLLLERNQPVSGERKGVTKRDEKGRGNETDEKSVRGG